MQPGSGAGTIDWVQALAQLPASGGTRIKEMRPVSLNGILHPSPTVHIRGWHLGGAPGSSPCLAVNVTLPRASSHVAAGPRPGLASLWPPSCWSDGPGASWEGVEVPSKRGCPVRGGQPGASGGPAVSTAGSPLARTPGSVRSGWAPLPGGVGRAAIQGRGGSGVPLLTACALAGVPWRDE